MKPFWKQLPKSKQLVNYAVLDFFLVLWFLRKQFYVMFNSWFNLSFFVELIK